MFNANGLNMHITDSIVLDDRAITEARFVRATGPGGQNVNKDATAVELRVDVRQVSAAARREGTVDRAGRQACDDRWCVDRGQPGAPVTRPENRDAARAGLDGALEASRQATKEAHGDEVRARPSARGRSRSLKSAGSAVKRCRSGRSED